jgi:hypothetical protein
MSDAIGATSRRLTPKAAARNMIVARVKYSPAAGVIRDRPCAEEIWGGDAIVQKQ